MIEKKETEKKESLWMVGKVVQRWWPTLILATQSCNGSLVNTFPFLYKYLSLLLSSLHIVCPSLFLCILFNGSFEHTYKYIRSFVNSFFFHTARLFIIIAQLTLKFHLISDFVKVKVGSYCHTGLDLTI